MTKIFCFIIQLFQDGKMSVIFPFEYSYKYKCAVLGTVYLENRFKREDDHFSIVHAKCISSNFGTNSKRPTICKV